MVLRLSSIHIFENKYGYNTGVNWEIFYKHNVSLVFVNTDFSLDYARPIMPHVIPIGGFTHRPLEPLKDEILTFVSNADHGIIVVAFGTLLGSLFDQSKVKLFCLYSAGCRRRLYGATWVIYQVTYPRMSN